MGFDMARIRVAILGAGRIAQHMADTLVKMAADSRYADWLNRMLSPHEMRVVRLIRREIRFSSFIRFI